jgi:hypothetical protein
MGRLLPICKPTPLAADDVHERVAHGMKAPARSRVNSSALSAEAACKTRHASKLRRLLLSRKA